MATLRLHASYLDTAINDPAKIIRNASEKLWDVEYDTLIGTGLSGALILPQLASALGRKFAVVRKADQSHSDVRVEGNIGDRWVFLDDLICSGDTLRRVHSEIAAISRHYSHTTEFVGAYLYCGNFYRAADALTNHINAY
jgi:orotate phosphoribosyltransferase